MERVAKWSPFFYGKQACARGMAERAAGRRLVGLAEQPTRRGLQADGYQEGLMCSVWVKEKRATAVALLSKHLMLTVAFYRHLRKIARRYRMLVKPIVGLMRPRIRLSPLLRLVDTCRLDR